METAWLTSKYTDDQLGRPFEFFRQFGSVIKKISDRIVIAMQK